MPESEEDFLSNVDKSNQCENYKGNDTAVSFFEILDAPMNQLYPFDGLRTLIDKRKFCESQGGPNTTFAIDNEGKYTDKR